MAAMVIMVMIVIVIMGVMVVIVVRVFMEGTGQDKLTFKLDFPGNLCMCREAFAILAMFPFYQLFPC